MNLFKIFTELKAMFIYIRDEGKHYLLVQKDSIHHNQSTSRSKRKTKRAHSAADNFSIRAVTGA